MTYVLYLTFGSSGCRYTSSGMNSAILYLFLSISIVAGTNIIVQHDPLHCGSIESGIGGCLRGQLCTPHGTCEIDTEESTTTTTSPPTLLFQRTYLPVAEKSSLNLSDTTPSTEKDRREIRRECEGVEGNLGYHDISSISPHVKPDSQIKHHSRGSEPTIRSPNDGDLPVPTPSSRNDSTTVDGLCGPNNGLAKCDHWPGGHCCSAYGFCGRTVSHCLYACQDGPCLNQSGIDPIAPVPADKHPRPGRFEIVGQSGVPAMAAGLMPNGRVFFLDKVENYTQIELDTGRYAYSAEYDPDTNDVVGLSYETNAFCSGGSFLADGHVISVGGNGPLDIDPTVGDGFDGIRYLERSQQNSYLDGQPWNEPGNKLSTPRWYASVQLLGDGRIFVASGSANGLNPTIPRNNNPTYEILDRSGRSTGFSVSLPILEGNQPYYMYPFIHLLKDGNIFIFVARSAEVFNVHTGTTARPLPDLLGDYRTYPNTGGSVLLPLSSENQWGPDIMVCGGGSYQGLASPTDASCGRIRPLAKHPSWEIDAMPNGRGMVEGTLLPDGTVVWLNGCKTGAQGFGVAKDPIYEAWIYDPKKPFGQRWAIGASSKVPRMYHSVALILLDGTVMIAGSNPAEQPVLETDPLNPLKAFPTEFRVEIYIPPYLDGLNALKRPTDVDIPTKYLPANGHRFSISFNIHTGAKGVKVALYHGGFVTHSVHMGHRMIYLDTLGFRPGRVKQEVTAWMPPSPNISPPGPYVIYVVVDGIPSVGQFVTVE